MAEIKKSSIVLNDEKYERVKVGDVGDFYEQGDASTVCTDCGAKYGDYHNMGCDCERCPVCELQLISCDCFEDEIELEDEYDG